MWVKTWYSKLQGFGPFSNLQKFETVGSLRVTIVQKLSKYLLIIQILTVSVNYSSIKRPIINYVQRIEAVVTDGVRHCYSNYLKEPISKVLNSKETTPISWWKLLVCVLKCAILSKTLYLWKNPKRNQANSAMWHNTFAIFMKFHETKDCGIPFVLLLRINLLQGKDNCKSW